MKYPVYNQTGKEMGEVTLPKNVFEVPMNADLVHQVLISYTANKRQVSAHTKNRGEVRGGGRKPWAQKHTGRARHGSIRSPIWIGGGISGGPRNEKVYEKDIPKKMKKKALFMVLSEKAKNDSLVVLDQINSGTAKTKEMAKIIMSLPCKSGTRLLAYDGDKNIFLAARNISKTGVLEVRNLNVADLLNYKYLVISKEGIKKLQETFLK